MFAMGGPFLASTPLTVLLRFTFPHCYVYNIIVGVLKKPSMEWAVDHIFERGALLGKFPCWNLLYRNTYFHSLEIVHGKR